VGPTGSAVSLWSANREETTGRFGDGTEPTGVRQEWDTPERERTPIVPVA